MLKTAWNVSSFALIVTVIAVSCSTIPEPFAPPPPDAHATAIFYSRWVDYLGRFDPETLQDGCRPALIEPRPDVPYRGTVVLIHAYGACPQQFFELADLLALQGYRSMLVLLPGHGRMQSGTSRVGQLPTGRNWRRQYDAFAAAVNGLMAYTEGARIIGGYSTGAAASLVIGSQAPSLYDRHIAWAPFFAAAEQASPDEAAKALESCLVSRSVGRAGYCGTSAADTEVPALLGQEAFETAIAGSGTAYLQIVASKDDAAVSNDRMIAAIAGLEHVSACMYPRGVPLSMLSPFDNPGVDMYWLDSLLNGAIDFISEGRPFPVRPGRRSGATAIPECALLTERID